MIFFNYGGTMAQQINESWARNEKNMKDQLYKKWKFRMN